MVDIIWDMETGDPDDFLTLLFLCGHPGVRLKAVTVTPGTPHQVGVVRWALAELGVDIPVGAFNLDHPRKCVSSWHYHTYGDIPPSRDALPGWQVLLEHGDADTTLVTGAPLKNLGALLARPEADSWQLGRWVAQGGFAGEGVVPPHLQLAKFKGMEVVPTYNFGGAPRAARAALDDARIGERRLVSKNVCHRVYYDHDLHRKVRDVMADSPALQLVYRGMDRYLSRKPGGKKFHDPLAACCAIDPAVGTWAEVEVFRIGGRWGSRPRQGSGTWIIVDYDPDRFHTVLLSH